MTTFNWQVVEMDCLTSDNFVEQTKDGVTTLVQPTPQFLKETK